MEDGDRGDDYDHDEDEDEDYEDEDEDEDYEDEDEDVLQVAALDVLLHTVKATCEGLIVRSRVRLNVHPMSKSAPSA